MKESRASISIITMGGIGTGSPELSNGIPVLLDFVNELSKNYNLCIYSLTPVNKSFVNTNFKIKSPSKKLNALQKLYWCLRNFRKTSSRQIIHAMWGYPQGLIGLLLKYIYHLPLVIHLHGGDSTHVPEIKYGVFSSRLRSRLLRWVYARADELVVLTEYQKSQLAIHFSGRRPNVIHYGVKSSSIHLIKDKVEAPFRLINIGHISPVKNQKLLLDTFHEILKEVDCELTIIGEDTLNGELELYADQLGIASKIRFTGVITHKDTLGILKKSHLLVHTSYFEAQCMAISEALANGIPVCGTHAGLLADLSGKCTLSSPIGDKNALVQNIKNLLSDRQAYEAMVNKGVAWSLFNSMTHTVEKFDKLYSQYLD